MESTPSTGGTHEPTVPASGRRADAPDVRAAQRFGRYAAVERLGAGGMGEVWKAWDETLSRWVALKIAKSVDAEDVERFRREAQLAAVLSHPNIAAIHEIGLTGDRPWIAMQYIEGETLRRAKGPLERRVRWVRDAARAVDHAHAKGIIHRDLKPENVMVAGDRVYVMDFGLARRVEGGASLTGSGAVIGTPAYMPPEQARGERTDTRSDVYGLGAILYEVLAGRPPFEGASVVAVLNHVIQDDPARVKSAAPELEAVALKCLEKDPTGRYATAEALAAELDRWLAGEPVEAKPPPVLRRFARAVSRRLGLVAVATAGVVLLVAGLLMVRLQQRGAIDRRIAALTAAVAELRGWTRQPSREMAAIEAEGRRLRGEIGAFIAEHGERPEGPHLLAEVGEALGEEAAAIRDAARAVERFPGHRPARELLCRLKVLSIAERYRRSTEIGTRLTPAALEPELEAAGSESEEGVVLAAALREAILGKDLPAACRRMEEEFRRKPSADAARWAGVWSAKFPEKREWYTRAVELAPFRGAFYWERGSVRLELNDWTGSLDDYNRAHDLGIRDWSLFANRGYIRLNRGTQGGPGAVDDWRAAIADERTCIERGGDGANIRFILGTAHMNLGEFERALEELTKSLAVDPDYVQALLNRALVHRQLRDNDSAVHDLTKLVALKPDWVQGRLVFGELYQSMGSMTQAYEHYSAAIKAAPQDPRGPRLRGELLAQMAGAIRSRDAAQAMKTLQYAVEDLELTARLAPADLGAHASLAETRMMRAQWYAMEGREEDAAVERVAALGGYDRAVDLAPARVDLRAWRGTIRLDHANHLRSRGRTREAVALAEQAEEDFTSAIKAGHQPEMAHGGRADARRQQGKFAEAIVDADEAVKLDGSRASSRIIRLRTLADASRQLRDKAEAERLRQRAMADVDVLRGMAVSAGSRAEVEEIARRLKGE